MMSVSIWHTEEWKINMEMKECVEDCIEYLKSTRYYLDHSSPNFVIAKP